MSEPYFSNQELADTDAYHEVEFIGEKIEDFNDSYKWYPPSEEDEEEFYQNIRRDQQKLQVGLDKPMLAKEALSAINAAVDTPYPKVSQLGKNMLEHNFPKIQEMISSRQNEVVALDALAKIASFSEKSSKRAKEIIANNLDLIKEELNSESGKISALHALNMILDSDNEEVANKSKQLLQNAIVNPETGLDPEIVGESLLMEKDSARIITGRIIRAKIESFGLNPDKFIDAWAASDLRDERDALGNLYVDNINSIAQIEQERPGITKVLQENFGIKDFARYPNEMLIAQYDQRDRTDIPYGVIFYPESDHTGAGYRDKEVLQQLYEQVKDSHAIRICEGDSKLKMARYLLEFDRKYGGEHKISFAVVAAHGSEDDIRLGESDKDKSILHRRDFNDPRLARFGKYFEDDATLILNSCNTGADEGIGQQLSAVIPKVIAPDSPTYISSISVKKSDEKLKFSVEYSLDAQARAFAEGRRLLSSTVSD